MTTQTNVLSQKKTKFMLAVAVKIYRREVVCESRSQIEKIPQKRGS
jgi:hypothetical protein